MDLKKTIIIKRSKLEQPLTRGIEMMMEEDGGRIMFLPDDCTVEYVGEDSNVLFEFPTIDRWIPVTERLPEKSGMYLISLGDLVTVGSFGVREFFSTHTYAPIEPIAWMPLPKPYEKGVKKNEVHA